jgi:hypothetical protein
MMQTVDNLFGDPTRPWWKCFAIAAFIEGAIVLFIASQFFGFGPLVAVGADNPVTMYLAVALQFPMSLLFNSLSRLAHSIGLSENLSFAFASASIAVTEFLLLAVFLRRPWRKICSATNVLRQRPR